jgi:hypothetical protein
MWQLLAKFQIILLHNGEDKINGKCEVKNFAARKKLEKILFYLYLETIFLIQKIY